MRRTTVQVSKCPGVNHPNLIKLRHPDSPLSNGHLSHHHAPTHRPGPPLSPRGSSFLPQGPWPRAGAAPASAACRAHGAIRRRAPLIPAFRCAHTGTGLPLPAVDGARAPGATLPAPITTSPRARRHPPPHAVAPAHVWPRQALARPCAVPAPATGRHSRARSQHSAPPAGANCTPARAPRAAARAREYESRPTRHQRRPESRKRGSAVCAGGS